jgi:hypothetical protein
MHDRPHKSSAPKRPRPGAPLLRGILAGLLGLAAALLMSCASSGGGLIPAADAGPLQSDFEAVERAAETGNGSCSSTEGALLKTEQDFRALPSTVNGGLRSRLEEGIVHLRHLALQACQQPGTQATVTASPPKTTTSTPTNTATTPTTPTTDTKTTPPPTTPSTTPTTTTPPGPGGGTPAGEPEATPAPGAGRGDGGGTGAGEGASPGAGGGK